MNLRQQILKEHSKRNTSLIVDYVGKDQNRMKELVSLFLTGDHRLAQMASWPISEIAFADHRMIEPYLPLMVKELSKPGLHHGVIRNTLRFLQELEIPEALEGEVLDHCLMYIRNLGIPVALKAYSLTIAGKLCLKYPELGNELKLLIADQLPQQSAAFKVRAARVLKQIDRQA